MDRSTEGEAQNSVLEFELFSAESVVNNGKGLFANLPISESGFSLDFEAGLNNL
jgi:hypothetical protein